MGNIAAAGTITILNPTGGAGNPIENDITAVILSVEDVIDQGGTLTGATVDCGESYPHTLNAGDTLVCTCTASPTAALAGVNTATVTIEGLVGTSEYSGTADLAFTENTIGVDEISVDDTNDGGDFGPVITTTT